MSVELFPYRGAAKDGGALEYALRDDEQRGKRLKVALSGLEPCGQYPTLQHQHNCHTDDSVAHEGDFYTPPGEIHFHSSTGRIGSAAQIQWK
jgi:hypothetical protein